jgi:Flp pilus assembly protein TadD
MPRCSLSAVLLFVAVFVSVPQLDSQTQPGPTARGGTTSAAFAAGITTTTQTRLPAVLTGSVIREDLQPVTDATVLLVCGGLVRGSAEVRANGEFSLAVERTLDGVHNVPVSGCEVHALSKGISSEPIGVLSLRPSETRDVGRLLIPLAAKEAGTMVSANSLAAPPQASKLLQKGKNAAGEQKWSDAQKYLEHATQVYPKYAEAWHELGLVYQHESRREEARQAFEQALAADPMFVRPYFGLVGLAADVQDWREMKTLSESANRLFSDPLMLFYHAIASFNLKDFGATEKSLLRAAELDRDHRLPQIELLLGDVLIQRRDFSGAAARVREFLALSPDGPQAEAARTELSRLEQLSSH